VGHSRRQAAYGHHFLRLNHDFFHPQKLIVDVSRVTYREEMRWQGIQQIEYPALLLLIRLVRAASPFQPARQIHG